MGVGLVVEVGWAVEVGWRMSAEAGPLVVGIECRVVGVECGLVGVEGGFPLPS